MNSKKLKTLKKISLIIGIAYIVLISIFAFDAFNSNDSFWNQLLGFAIHLIPSLILAITLWIACKHNLVGGLLFIAIGIIFTIFFNTYTSFLTFFIISLPTLLIGVLFLVIDYKTVK